MMTHRPKRYGSFADFEREELRPMNKVGFCVDDLEVEATFRQFEEFAPDSSLSELDFG